MRPARIPAIPAHAGTLLFLLSASGCAQWIGIEDLPQITDALPRDRPDADLAAPDASGTPIDGSPGANCGWPFAPRHFDPCAQDNPSGLSPLVLADEGTYIYNTDSGLLIDPLGSDVSPPPSTLAQSGDVRALWVNGLDLQNGSTLRVTGTKPLMIVSTDAIRVSGVLDVSSTFNAASLTFDPGAGADPPSAECTSNDAQVGGDCSQGGGGGGGGGFGGAGGEGGRGSSTADCGAGPIGIAGGTGGNSVPLPTTIRGGCKGARGGNGEVAMLYGLGGLGGGAVYLVSPIWVDIQGTIHAGGAAGTGAEGGRSGGGGAGSGGFIGLEAPNTDIGPGAILAANGGGGGGGTHQGTATSGEDGKTSDQPAIGGAGQGSVGGNGSAGSNSTGGRGQDGTRGGGGGGGGAGFIITYQSTPIVASQATISPPLTQR